MLANLRKGEAFLEDGKSLRLRGEEVLEAGGSRSSVAEVRLPEKVDVVVV